MTSASTAHVADLIILGFLALTALVGFISGFTRLVLGIFAWVGALWLATLSVPVFSPFVIKYVPHPLAANVISGSVTFIITLSIFIYISRTIGSAVKSSSLGGVDRTIGLLFGVCAGAFMFSGVFNFAHHVLTPEKYNDLMTHARSAPYLQKGAELTKHVFFIFAKTWIPELIPADTATGGVTGKTAPQPAAVPAPHPQQTSSGYEGSDRQALENIIQQDTVVDAVTNTAIQAVTNAVTNATAPAAPQEQPQQPHDFPAPAAPQETPHAEAASR